jgi:hypothetical protein
MHASADPKEGVDSLVNGLINDLSVLVVVFEEHINLCNHSHHVDASGGLRGIWCSDDTSRVASTHIVRLSYSPV